MHVSINYRFTERALSIYRVFVVNVVNVVKKTRNFIVSRGEI